MYVYSYGYHCSNNKFTSRIIRIFQVSGYPDKFFSKFQAKKFMKKIQKGVK